MAVPDYKNLLEKFDDLTTRGIIQYSPPRKVEFEDDGFTFEFYITDALSSKPQAGEAVQTEDHPTRFGPGSDILNNNSEMLLANINSTHLLVLNKFCVFRSQLLLLTADSYRRQSEQLDLEDFKAVCDILPLMGDPHMAMYNCGAKSGASRQHKHIHVLPRPSHLFPDDRNFDPAKIPFLYLLQYLDKGIIGSRDGPQVLLQTYQDLLGRAKQASSNCSEDAEYAHNIVLTNEWLIVIPRSRAIFEGIATNAAGMVGSVWLNDDIQMDDWKAKGPKKVLRQLGLPRVQNAVGL
ncbi:uncharacterized protein K452DRAFT_237249 [Aplosporella prunicola CBS 121167]|uniref:Uncharacterized protein n=1 Tax=Aplosporella prunicola CBS 121167 TaxID=1176127 RepID=A0A6A6B043_9PEZI|nr:uncharacterized protein K452DRAFT_237249 [Aplosporella prunicola CBS 121167]KAF2136614.1 hypothetical protein K452DRAFT_237249 [Aplosporella prunicola CBS 121167]